MINSTFKLDLRNRNFHLEDRGGNLYFLSELLNLKDFQSHHKVLEIGCGTGVLGHYFKSITSAEVFGTELSEKAYKTAKNRIKCSLVKDGEIPIELMNLDLVYCKDVLPMIKDKRIFYSNIYSRLNDDGIFCTYMPDYIDIDTKPILKFIPKSIEKSKKAYETIETNINYLEYSGFNNVSQREINLGTFKLNIAYCLKHMDGFFSNTDQLNSNTEAILLREQKLNTFMNAIIDLEKNGIVVYYNWRRTLIIAKK